MKKRFILSMLIILIIASLCACKNESNKTNSTSDFSEYTQLYKNVLDSHYNIVNNPKQVVSEPSGGELGVIEACKVFEDTSIDNIGYKFMDINNDEIPELIIGTSNPDYYAHVNNEIYALYGLKNKVPYPLVEGTARNIYSITKDNKLYNYGSNGAMNTVFACYNITPALDLECEHFYFTDKKEDNVNQIGYFHNKTGNFDKVLSEELNIRPEAFWNIEQGFADSTINIDFTPFSQYKLR